MLVSDTKGVPSFGPATLESEVVIQRNPSCDAPLQSTGSGNADTTPPMFQLVVQTTFPF